MYPWMDHLTECGLSFVCLNKYKHIIGCIINWDIKDAPPTIANHKLPQSLQYFNQMNILPIQQNEFVTKYIYNRNQTIKNNIKLGDVVLYAF